MANDLIPAVPPARPPNVWPGYVTWPVVLAFAWAVYEWTTDPAAAAAALCIKFGQPDFHTGYWLWRKDRKRIRAAANALLWFAWGLWKAAAAGGLVLMTVELPDGLRAAALAPTEQNIVFCAAGAGALTLLSFLLACTWKVPLWVHPDLHRSRYSDTWPPYPSSVKGVNR